MFGNYGIIRPAKIIPHFARFIAQVWQVHPFGEGNTRTTAVFAIKYLRSLGYHAPNNMFKENSWYFRNALVRANYADYPRGVKREWGYLEAFFRNLLIGEKNELKSHYLLIGIDRPPPRFDKGDATKVVRKGCQKTVDRLAELLGSQPNLTQVGMAAALGISRQAIQKHIAHLKSAGRLHRFLAFMEVGNFAVEGYQKVLDYRWKDGWSHPAWYFTEDGLYIAAWVGELDGQRTYQRTHRVEVVGSPLFHCVKRISANAVEGIFLDELVGRRKWYDPI